MGASPCTHRPAARRFAALLAFFSIATAPTLAQEEAPPRKPAFQQLFPKPTGRNGYEEIVMAADLATAASDRKDLSQRGVTLSEKRDGVRDQDRTRALALLSAGLKKPISSPRTTITFQSTLPDLAGMRVLARLLATDMYVRFADGRITDAITDLRDGLSLAAILNGETLIGSLVAIAIDSIVIVEFARHVDQLSAKDCDRVVETVKAWMKLPDPTITALDCERRLLVTNLEAMKTDPKHARETADALLNEEIDAAPETQATGMIEALLSNREALSSLVDEAIVRVNTHFARLFEQLRRPAWERKPVEAPKDDSPAGWLVGKTLPALTQAMSRFTVVSAKVRMLGVDAAVRRFRWEHNALPETLEELGQPTMVIDPFVGKPFLYRQHDDRTFEIKSGGTDGRTKPFGLIPSKVFDPQP